MNPLVAPAWLAARLDDPAVVILDATLPVAGVTPPVDTRAQYLARHIPGAVFFDIDELSDHSTALPHMLPTAEEFARSMSALGVNDEQCIVVYEQEGVYSAPRAWWMLRNFGVRGARDVHVLDGGLRAWIEAGYRTDSGPVERAPASFHASLNRDAVKDFALIQRMIAEGAQSSQLQSSQLYSSQPSRPQIGVSQILDARSPERFRGAAPEPRPGVDSGHMPGSINVHYAELAEGGRMLPEGKLRELFASKGVDVREPITTMCGSGVTAAVIALALEICGAERVSLYDGSWAEYATQPGVVIEKDA